MEARYVLNILSPHPLALRNATSHAITPSHWLDISSTQKWCVFIVLYIIFILSLIYQYVLSVILFLIYTLFLIYISNFKYFEATISQILFYSLLSIYFFRPYLPLGFFSVPFSLLVIRIIWRLLNIANGAGRWINTVHNRRY